MIPDRARFESDVEARTNAHLEAVQEALSKSDISPLAKRSILDDVRTQIADMLTARAGKEATLTDLEEVLSRMDSPHSYAEQQEPPSCAMGPVKHPDGADVPSDRSTRSILTKPISIKVPLVVLGGIILPLVALVVELVAQLSADIYLDPIPSLWHVLLVATVPVANGAVLAATIKNHTRFARPLGFLNALAITVAFVYTMVYLPMLPVGFIGMLVGFGFLPLAPIFSFFAAAKLRQRYKACFPSEQKAPIGRFRWGMLTAFTVFALLDGASLVTSIGAEMALSENPRTQARGIWWLRTLGSDNYLLRWCYPKTERGEFLDSSPAIKPADAQRLYYQVTGMAFNEVMPPRDVLGSKWESQSLMALNPDVRDESGLWQQPELTLASSRLDGVLDSDGGFGYLEWMISFENRSSGQHEAVSEIALPPGGVVSRLTLWVNDEEREAAFAGRADVKKAYEQVVARRRDPVVVTTSGSDRVQMRCFPVPAGGTMKVRLGITFPLVIESREKVIASLPYFLDRNFQLPEKVTHNVWVESKQPFDNLPACVKTEPGEDGGMRLVGALSSKDLNSFCRFACRRNAAAALTTWPDLLEPAQFKLSQQLAETTVSASRKLIVVVDGSLAMQEYLPGIAEALKAVPSNVEVSLVAASEKPLPVDFSNPVSATPEALQTLAHAVRQLPVQGGQDNVPALARALELTGSRPDSTVIWIHGPQPVNFAPPETLMQRFERVSRPPQMYHLQVAPGPNPIVKALDRACELKSVARVGSPGEDLKRLFSSWKQQGTQLVWKRDRVALSQGEQPPTTATRFSGHVARLWAFDRVLELFRSRQPGQQAQAVDLASKHQLVTPPTGAVVLETKQQYDEAGLKPVDASSVPTIPEPETWALIAVAAGVLGAAIIAQRKKQLGAC